MHGAEGTGVPHLCAKADALSTKFFAQLPAQNAVWEAWKILHISGRGQLPARRNAVRQPALKKQWFQLRPGCVDSCT